LTSAFQRWAN